MRGLAQEYNGAIPGNEVDDNIDVVEVRWDLVDVGPTG